LKLSQLKFHARAFEFQKLRKFSFQLTLYVTETEGKENIHLKMSKVQGLKTIKVSTSYNRQNEGKIMRNLFTKK
jgi:archaellin